MRLLSLFHQCPLLAARLWDTICTKGGKYAGPSALQAKDPAQQPPQAFGGTYHNNTHMNMRLPSVRLYSSIWKMRTRRHLWDKTNFSFFLFHVPPCQHKIQNKEVPGPLKRSGQISTLSPNPGSVWLDRTAAHSCHAGFGEFFPPEPLFAQRTPSP